MKGAKRSSSASTEGACSRTANSAITSTYHIVPHTQPKMRTFKMERRWIRVGGYHPGGGGSGSSRTSSMTRSLYLRRPPSNMARRRSNKPVTTTRIASPAVQSVANPARRVALEIAGDPSNSRSST